MKKRSSKKGRSENAIRKHGVFEDITDGIRVGKLSGSDLILKVISPSFNPLSIKFGTSRLMHSIEVYNKTGGVLQCYQSDSKHMTKLL